MFTRAAADTRSWLGRAILRSLPPGSRSVMANADATVIVDARGQRCPHPVLAARAALKNCASGSRIVLLATDPLAPVDVAAWCARTGCRLIEETSDATTFRFVIEQA